jgi:phosphonate transport system permease protein
MVTVVGLGIWRISNLARLETGAFAVLRKAFQRQPGFVSIIIIGVIGLWLWTAWDAYRSVRDRRKGSSSIFLLILAVLFVLGWQIGEIDLYTLTTELPDAWDPLSRVIWPWAAAFERESESLSAGADVLSPCDDEAPPSPPEEIPGQPYLVADPTCGELSSLDEENQVVFGTTLHVIGRGFVPNRETQIWWADPIGNEFRVRQEGEYLTVQTDDQGAFESDVIMPYRLIPPSSQGRQIHRIEARQVSSTGALQVADPLKLSLARMVETIIMGMMATVFGILFSIPVSFMAARNIMYGSWVTITLYYLTRTILNIIRSIEPMIWAIIALIVVGLGPFAGIIALTVHSVAALGKLYSEAIEGIDPGPIEALQAVGANRLQTIVYAVIPQMIAPFVSFSIYRWDINVRMSTVIGLVGGGGIGFLLIQYIRLLDYRAAGIPIWFIAITVAILDYVSSEIRQRFV